MISSLVQFFTPNRERRLLTVYPGSTVCNHNGTAEVFQSDAQRQGSAAAEAAGDRFAVDWSGSFIDGEFYDRLPQITLLLYHFFRLLSHYLRKLMLAP